MNNIILLTHGEFSKGIAQSCRFILGEVPNLTALSISLDETIDEASEMIVNARAAFENDEQTILITDIPGGSTTQAAIRVLAEQPDLYLVTGLNLGLLAALLMLDLTDNESENRQHIRMVIAQARDTIMLVNDRMGNTGINGDEEL